MLTIGLTGNIAAGKSTVSSFFAEQGVPVVDADQIAREVVAPGTRGLERVVEAFGPSIVTSDGALDRTALRTIAFADPAIRKQLESILHPMIREQRSRWLRDQHRRSAEIVVAEIPLLFEQKLAQDFDRTVLVDAPESIRILRLVSLRGYGEEEARRAMAAQMPAELKRARADYVIENTGSIEALRAATRVVLDHLRRISCAL